MREREREREREKARVRAREGEREEEREKERKRQRDGENRDRGSEGVGGPGYGERAHRSTQLVEAAPIAQAAIMSARAYCIGVWALSTAWIVVTGAIFRLLRVFTSAVIHNYYYRKLFVRPPSVKL